MPTEAWVEIRDEKGELLVSIQAEISGGTITAELPAFEPGQLGTMQLCERWADGEVFCEEKEEPEQLPLSPGEMWVQL